MIIRCKKSISLFLACAMFLSILCSGVDAAVATLFTKGQSGRFVEISIKYDSQSNIKIDTVVLYIDNIVYEKKKLPKPAKQGVVSFDWDTQSYAKGQHYIEARLYANNKLVTAVNGSGVVSDAVFDVDAPVVSLANVKDGEYVTGTKVIKINAKDNSGEAPIVSFLVDKKLKLMQNTQPYQYTLDSTKMSNGKHVIEVYAFDLEGNQSDVVTYTINVVNSESQEVASASVKTNTVDLDTPKDSKRTLASRPSLNNSATLEAGRVSDSEISASINSVKTSTIVAPNSQGVLVSPKINEEISTKIVLKDPVVASKNANVSVANTNDIKVSVSQKTSASSLSAPSINAEPLLIAKNQYVVVETNLDTPVVSAPKTAVSNTTVTAPKTVATNTNATSPKTVANTTAPKTVSVAPEQAPSMNLTIVKKVSDSSVVANELKLATGTRVSEASLDAPKTVATQPVEVKSATVVKSEPAGEVLVAKNVTNVSVATTSDLKVAVASSQVANEVNAPSVKVSQAPAEKPVASVKVAQAPAEKPVAPVKVAQTPAEKAVAPVKVAQAPAEKTVAPVKVAQAPAQTTPAKTVAPAKPAVEKAPVSLKKAKLRDLVEEQNGTLLWDNKTKTVTAYVNNCKVEMKIGSKKVKVNGNPLTINLVPQLKNGRTIIDVTDFNNIVAEAKK